MSMENLLRVALLCFQTYCAIYCTHYTVRHLLERGEFEREAAQFLASTFGRGPNDDELARRSWWHHLLFMAAVSAFTWWCALDSLWRLPSP